jgi:hypothetical protein
VSKHPDARRPSPAFHPGEGRVSGRRFDRQFGGGWLGVTPGRIRSEGSLGHRSGCCFPRDFRWTVVRYLNAATKSSFPRV